VEEQVAGEAAEVAIATLLEAVTAAEEPVIVKADAGDEVAEVDLEVDEEMIEAEVDVADEVASTRKVEHLLHRLQQHQPQATLDLRLYSTSYTDGFHCFLHQKVTFLVQYIFLMVTHCEQEISILAEARPY